ncbi:MAG: CPBP family intramembrane metalloprotease [Patescibacteria group bacterium]|nr:CPBP family intramembrane metalloprotease [Patescibacteria group bacterium]
MFNQPVSKTKYILGLAITLGAIYSQYLLGIFGKPWRLFYVYGIPILGITLLMKSAIFKKALTNNKTALKFGLAYYGLFTLLGFGAASLVFYLIGRLDPSAIDLLNKPNPVLHVSLQYAKIMVFLSFVVIGPAEEFIFRGFVFGGLLNMSKGRRWLTLALLSSLIFAGAHLYYILVYGVNSIGFLIDITAFALAMCFTYYLSGGNLLVPAMLHGFYDATGFLSIAAPSFPAMWLRYGAAGLGFLIFLKIFIQKFRQRRQAA